MHTLTCITQTLFFTFNYLEINKSKIFKWKLIHFILPYKELLKQCRIINNSDCLVCKENDYSGYSVSNAGDVNGDGLDDLIVSARKADPSGQSNAGKSYVVFGKQDNTDAIELSAIAAGTSTSCLPNTTYDLPAFDLLLGLA
jgi:hypothetical protein